MHQEALAQKAAAAAAEEAERHDTVEYMEQWYEETVSEVKRHVFDNQASLPVKAVVRILRHHLCVAHLVKMNVGGKVADAHDRCLANVESAQFDRVPSAQGGVPLFLKKVIIIRL